MVKSIFTNKQNDKEKEKEKEEDNKIEFLSKKRVEPDTPKEEVDMIQLKKKVNEIMYSICNEEKNSINDLDILYESMNKNYLSNEFTTNCLNYINKIIINMQKNHLKRFEGIYELNKIFISIIKELLMNEFEILLLSLYLEIIDISLCEDINSFKESVTFLSYFIKKLSLFPEKLTPINSFLIRKYQGFEDKFNKWFELNSSIINNKLYFSYAEINQRFKEFSKPYSIYCKNNFLDYNLVIDRILKMSVPYNESKRENISLINKNKDLTGNLRGSQNIFEENRNNANINQNFVYGNNDKFNYNNLNNFNNLYQGIIPNYQSGIFANQTNKNINFGYLYNNSNILCPINKINDEKINVNISNDNNSQIEEHKNKGAVKFKLIKENNNIKDTGKNEPKEDNINPKLLFVTKIQNNSTDTGNDSKDNGINNNEIQDNELNSNKIDAKIITQNNMLHALKPEDVKEQNNLVYNNQNNYIQKNFNNNSNLNSATSKNNNIFNLYQNNLLGLNISQQMNEFNPLKYNTNIGINDINSASQLSFISIKSPYLFDFNNCYNNPFQGIDAEEKYRQLLNQSNENFCKSILSMNNINSSNNFYANTNNNNFVNKDILGNENNNNINPSFKPILIGNSILQNKNNISANDDNFGVPKEKIDDENGNKNNN